MYFDNIEASLDQYYIYTDKYINMDKWNYATAWEREDMVRPAIREFIKWLIRTKNLKSDVLDALFNELTENNEHTAVRVLKHEIVAKISACEIAPDIYLPLLDILE